MGGVSEMAEQAVKVREEVRSGLRLAQATAAGSILLNSALAAAKYALGAACSSLALKADALHSLTDIAASAAVFMGIRLSRRRTAEFPYGLYKLENLVGLAIALAIFLAAYEMAREAVMDALGMAEREPLRNLTLGVVGVLAIAGCIAGWVLWVRHVARVTRSAALEADVAHMAADALAALAILASFIAAWFGLNFDWAATLIVVGFVALTGWHLAANAVRVLLDASVEPEVLEAVRRAVEAHPDVVRVREVRGRNSGSFRFIELSVELDVHDLERAHEIAGEIERIVREAATNVDEVLVHYEPERKPHFTIALPLDETGRLSEEFGKAATFRFVKIRRSDGQAVERREVPNPYRDMGRGRGILVAQMLLREGVDVLATRDHLEGHGPYYVLRDARVKIVEVSDENPEEVVRAVAASEISNATGLASHREAEGGERS